MENVWFLKSSTSIPLDSTIRKINLKRVLPTTMWNDRLKTLTYWVINETCPAWWLWICHLNYPRLRKKKRQVITILLTSLSHRTVMKFKGVNECNCIWKNLVLCWFCVDDSPLVTIPLLPQVSVQRLCTPAVLVLLTISPSFGLS